MYNDEFISVHMNPSLKPPKATLNSVMAEVLGKIFIFISQSKFLNPLQVQHH